MERLLLNQSQRDPQIERSARENPLDSQNLIERIRHHQSLIRRSRQPSRPIHHTVHRNSEVERSCEYYSFNNLVIHAKFSDITVIFFTLGNSTADGLGILPTQEKVFKLHKLILCRESEYFAELLSESDRNHWEMHVFVDDLNDIDQVLEFMYDGKTNKPPTPSAYQVAHQLRIQKYMYEVINHLELIIHPRMILFGDALHQGTDRRQIINLWRGLAPKVSRWYHALEWYMPSTLDVLFEAISINMTTFRCCCEDRDYESYANIGFGLSAFLAKKMEKLEEELRELRRRVDSSTSS